MKFKYFPDGDWGTQNPVNTLRYKKDQLNTLKQKRKMTEQTSFASSNLVSQRHKL